MLELLFALADESDYEKIEYLAETFYNDLLVYAKRNLEIRPLMGYEPEDAVQDTYVRITLKIDHVDFTLSDVEIGKYLRQVLVHIIANKREESQNAVLMGDTKEQISSPDDFVYLIMEEYEREAVTEALKQLEDLYRVPLTLKYREGYSPKKIAELLNKPVKTVYTNIERGLVLLKKQLEEGGWTNG